MRKSIFRTNHTYHNCLLQSSHLENPSKWGGSWEWPVPVRKLLTKWPQLGLYHYYYEH